MPGKATRRTFLKLSAAAASLTAAKFAHATPSQPVVSIGGPAAPLTQSEPVQWALSKLREALAAKGIAESLEKFTHGILVAPVSTPSGQAFARQFNITAPETVAIIPAATQTHKPGLVVTGVDARGLVYGLLELADRVQVSDDPIAALNLPAPIIETTPNKVRSVARAFVSEVEDKPWYYDRAFWTSYLDTLAAARFNRFNLAFGFGWDFPRGVTGDYFHFPYPYLVEVPGYEQVHVEPVLKTGERQRNLETLQFIAAEAARRGMDFQLGIWTHAYQWTDSPHSDHHIVGLTPEIHAAYCRDALAAVLKACPQITGLTMRIHGESGIPEGSYSFWQTLWEAVPAARTPDGKPRIIELDLHAKGLDPRTIEIARATGMPVKAGAKYWAEHLGLSYHQADIRAAEYPRAGVTGTFAVSSGARNFTRYGYGDFYQEGIGLDLLYRVWPGTQRHLLWGDPALAAGYGRAANFCGAAGMELCDPLTFKGREGSGHPGGRNAYTDASLAAPDLDTAKFAVTYLLWGRYLYNPDTAPDFHHRYFKQTFGAAGPALETALAASSRILPLVTTAWCPSASNHEFWPEMFTPLSILPYTTRPLYTDSPAPHNVSAISPLDPQLFTTIDQHAENLISGKPDARYNTSEVIQWLEAMVATSAKGLAAARTAAGPKHITPEFRRAEEDILILNGLGSYFANLFHAALMYTIDTQKPSSFVIGSALEHLIAAIEDWRRFSERAAKVYSSDISYGRPDFRRGNWTDRLPAMEADRENLEQVLSKRQKDEIGLIGGGKDRDFEQLPGSIVISIVRRAGSRTPRPTIAAKHTVPESFHPRSDLALTIATPPTITEAILWYRHVNHGERWLSAPMQQAANSHTAAIPAAYTNSPYPLQYYFELHTDTSATLHPPFNPTLSNQPYFAIYKRT